MIFRQLMSTDEKVATWCSKRLCGASGCKLLLIERSKLTENHRQQKYMNTHTHTHTHIYIYIYIYAYERIMHAKACISARACSLYFPNVSVNNGLNLLILFSTCLILQIIYLIHNILWYSLK